MGVEIGSGPTQQQPFDISSMAISAWPTTSSASGTSDKRTEVFRRLVPLDDSDDYLPELPVVFEALNARGVRRAQALDELEPGYRPPSVGRIDDRLSWSTMASQGSEGRPSPPLETSLCSSPGSRDPSRSPASKGKAKAPATAKKRKKPENGDQNTLESFFKASKPSAAKAPTIIDLTDSSPIAGPSRKTFPSRKTLSLSQHSRPALVSIVDLSSSTRSSASVVQSSPGAENDNPFQCESFSTRLSPFRQKAPPETSGSQRPSTPTSGSSVGRAVPRSSSSVRREHDNPFQAIGETTFLTPPALRSQPVADPNDDRDRSSSYGVPDPDSKTVEAPSAPPASGPAPNLSSQRPARDLHFVRRLAAEEAEGDGWYEPDRSPSPETEMEEGASDGETADEPPVETLAVPKPEAPRAPARAPSPRKRRPPKKSAQSAAPAPTFNPKALWRQYPRFRLLDPEWPQPKVVVCPSPSHPFSSLPALIAEVVADGTPLDPTSQLRRRRIVGFDLEWKVSRWRGAGEHRASIMQLASLSKALVIRLSDGPGWSEGRLPPEVVTMVLTDPDVVKVGVNIRGDGLKLLRDFPASFPRHRGSGFRSYIEFSHLARKVDPEKVGQVARGRTLVSLQKLTAMFLGQYLSKGADRTGDWESKGRELTKSQVECASSAFFA